MSGNQEESVLPMQTELSALGMDDEDWLKDRPQPAIPPEDTGEPVGVEDPSDEPDQTDRERSVKAGQALCRALDQLLAYAQDARDAANLLVESFAAPPPSEAEAEEPETQTKDGEPDAPVPQGP